MTDRLKGLDLDSMFEGKPNKTTEVRADIKVNSIARAFTDEGKVIYGVLEDGMYWEFLHNNSVWRFNVATTLARTMEGHGPDDLLLNMNGHYKGSMNEAIMDNIIGIGATLYAMTRVKPEGA